MQTETTEAPASLVRIRYATPLEDVAVPLSLLLEHAQIANTLQILSGAEATASVYETPDRLLVTLLKADDSESPEDLGRIIPPEEQIGEPAASLAAVLFADQRFCIIANRHGPLRPGDVARLVAFKEQQGSKPRQEWDRGADLQVFVAFIAEKIRALTRPRKRQGNEEVALLDLQAVWTRTVGWQDQLLPALAATETSTRILRVVQHPSGGYDAAAINLAFPIPEFLLPQNAPGRNKSNARLSFAKLSTLLMLTGGHSCNRGPGWTVRRWIPTAGNKGSFDLFVESKGLAHFDDALYAYDPDRHTLARATREHPFYAWESQRSWRGLRKRPAAALEFASVPRRLAAKYGTFADRLVWFDLGAALVQALLLCRIFMISAHVLVFRALREPYRSRRPDQGGIGAVVLLEGEFSKQEAALDLCWPVPERRTSSAEAQAWEDCFLRRRSIRKFNDGPVSLHSIQQACQSALSHFRELTPKHLRAGIGLTLLAGKVAELSPGFYGVDVETGARTMLDGPADESAQNAGVSPFLWIVSWKTCALQAAPSDAHSLSIRQLLGAMLAYLLHLEIVKQHLGSYLVARGRKVDAAFRCLERLALHPALAVVGGVPLEEANREGESL